MLTQLKREETTAMLTFIDGAEMIARATGKRVSEVARAIIPDPEPNNERGRVLAFAAKGA